MTDQETLFEYRLREADETLHDAEKMIGSDFTPRTIINRGYYAMFYATLALFIYSGINPKTSKHSGVISIFDRDFVHTGKFDKRYSKIIHKMFDLRQQGDYRELIELTIQDAKESITMANEYITALKAFMGK